MSASILVVDDSLTVRMDLKEAFSAAGFSVVTCGTVEEARAALTAGDFGLCVLDVLLPDGDGVELLRWLRAQPGLASAFVLMLSTEAEVKDRVRGLATGADEYVGKPYNLEYVVRRASELLRGKTSDVPVAPVSVLVIDDSETFREALRERLHEAGYQVFVADNGEAGLRLAADVRPSMIVVDGVMPGLDGPTVIRRIRLDAALRATPCVLLTGSEAHDSEIEALDSGADAFARKDGEVDVLLARLGALLRDAGERSMSAPASLQAPKKILAVDDSPTYLGELASVLRSEGYDVIPARSGEEALELLAAQQVDCILLDVIMPGLGGRKTCAQIKASPALRDTPLIMLTAIDDREAMIGGLIAGADDYISKSSDLEVLRARVRAQLRRKQSELETRQIREQLLQKEIEAAEARSARLLAETRLALAQELERKNRELEAFSYSVSHDLRAPLRSIDGFSQALLEDYGESLPSAACDYLHRVRAAAQRMGELIDDLLALSRVTRMELRREHVDLTGLTLSVAGQLRAAHPDRDVDVVVEDGLSAHADSRLVRVLLENLLGNAWKFTVRSPRARVEVGRLPQARPARFFVRDNGVGFNMAYVDKLFRPFQRLHADADFPGTGIGLATVYRVVDRHGGVVEARGAVGEGATFSFTLPSSVGRNHGDES